VKQDGGLIAEILVKIYLVIDINWQNMALPPVKEGEKSLVISRLSGKHVFVFLMNRSSHERPRSAL